MDTVYSINYEGIYTLLRYMITKIWNVLIDGFVILILIITLESSCWDGCARVAML